MLIPIFFIIGFFKKFKKIFKETIQFFWKIKY